MILYHFCATRHHRKILHEGVTKGILAAPHGAGTLLKEGYQWLTTDPDPNNQSWATHELIDYDRTAYRFEISIPKSKHQYLQQAIKVAPWLTEGWPGSEAWYYYSGMIPNSWITDVKRRTECIKELRGMAHGKG